MRRLGRKRGYTSIRRWNELLSSTSRKVANPASCMWPNWNRSCQLWYVAFGFIYHQSTAILAFLRKMKNSD